MRILACFKVLPEFERVVDPDWENFDPSSDLGYVGRAFGCFDETVLETALRLKDALLKTGSDAECCALTLGPLPPLLCRHLFASGFDRVLAGAVAGLEFRHTETAAALGGIAKTMSCDLILAGRQAGYADTGMVPLLLAEVLSVPVVSEVETVSLPLGLPPFAHLIFERTCPNKRERVGVRLPALAVMGNSRVSALRAATLAAQMKVAGVRPESFPVSGFDVAKTKTPTLVRRQQRRNCVFLPAGDGLATSVSSLDEKIREWGGR